MTKNTDANHEKSHSVHFRGKVRPIALNYAVIRDFAEALVQL